MRTLYEAVGGEERVRAILTVLYRRMFDDPIVGFLFRGKDLDHIVDMQTSFTCRFLGGPQRYTGKALPEAHESLPLLPGHFDRRHWLLRQVLEEEGVPDDVRRVWLRIDEALRSSVLGAGEDARDKTRMP